MDNYIFGKKAILDAINNNKKITSIKLISNYTDIINLAKKNQIKFEIVEHGFFNQFKNVNHQNIIAFLDQQIKFIDVNYILKKDLKTILILDEIESPQNFGSILRTACAFNVDAVIFKNKNQCPINDLVIKTSMGGINYLNLCKVSNINHVIDILKENNYWIYGSCLDDKSLDLNQINFDTKSVIIVGNENHGINKLTLSKCDFLIKIKMSNIIDSLNVSVATGIILNKVFNK